MASSPQCWQAADPSDHSLRLLTSLELDGHPLPAHLVQLPLQPLKYQPSPKESIFAPASVVVEALCQLLGLKEDSSTDGLLDRLELELTQLHSLQTSQLRSSIGLIHWANAIHLLLVDNLRHSGHPLQACSLSRLLLVHQPKAIRRLYHLILASIFLDLDQPIDATVELHHASTLSDRDSPALQEEADVLHARLHLHRLQFDQAYYSFTLLSIKHPGSVFVRQMRILSALISSPELCMRRLQEIDEQAVASEQHPLLASLIGWTQNPTHTLSACVWDRLVQVVPSRFLVEGHLEQAFKELKLFLYSKQYEALDHAELAHVLGHSSDDEGLDRSLDFVDAMIVQRKLHARIEGSSGHAPVVFDDPPQDPLGHLICKLPPAVILLSDPPTPQSSVHLLDDSNSSPMIPASPSRRSLSPDHERDVSSSRLRKRRKLSRPNRPSQPLPRTNPSQDRPVLDRSDSSEPEQPLAQLPRPSARVSSLTDDDLPDMIACSATAEEGVRALRAYEAYRSKGPPGRPPRRRYNSTLDKNLTRVRRYLKFYESFSGVGSGWPITARKVEIWVRQDPPSSGKALKGYLRSLEGARVASEKVFQGRYEGREVTRLQEDEQLARLAKRPVPSVPASGEMVREESRRASARVRGRTLVIVDSDDEPVSPDNPRRSMVIDCDDDDTSALSERTCECREVPVLWQDEVEMISEPPCGRAEAPVLCQDEAPGAHQEENDVGANVVVVEQGSCEIRAVVHRTGSSDFIGLADGNLAEPGDMDGGLIKSSRRGGHKVLSAVTPSEQSIWETQGGAATSSKLVGSSYGRPSPCSNRFQEDVGAANALGTSSSQVASDSYQQSVPASGSTSPGRPVESRAIQTLVTSTGNDSDNAQQVIPSANGPTVFSSPLSSPALFPPSSDLGSCGGSPLWDQSGEPRLGEAEGPTEGPEAMSRWQCEGDVVGGVGGVEEEEQRWESASRGEGNEPGCRGMANTLGLRLDEDQEYEETHLITDSSSSSLLVGNGNPENENGNSTITGADDHQMFLKNLNGFVGFWNKFL